QVIEFLRGIKAPSEYLSMHFRDKETPTERVCTTCSHVGHPSRQMAGRDDVERALWAVVLVLAAIYVADYFTLYLTSFILFRWLFKLTSMAGKVFIVLSLGYTMMRFSICTNTCPK